MDGWTMRGANQMGYECRQAQGAISSVRPVRKIFCINPSDWCTGSLGRHDTGNGRSDNCTGGQETDASVLKCATNRLGVVGDRGSLASFEVGYC